MVNFLDLGNNDRNYDFQTLNPWTPFDHCDARRMRMYSWLLNVDTNPKSTTKVQKSKWRSKTWSSATCKSSEASPNIESSILKTLIHHLYPQCILHGALYNVNFKVRNYTQKPRFELIFAQNLLEKLLQLATQIKFTNNFLLLKY